MKPAHVPPARPAGVPLIGARPPSSTGPASTPSPFPADHHDWLAQRMNDVVVRRIFAAGLDLQAALGLIGGEHRAALKICHATDELDHAIRDIRDILFDRAPGSGRPTGHGGRHRDGRPAGPWWRSLRQRPGAPGPEGRKIPSQLTLSFPNGGSQPVNGRRGTEGLGCPGPGSDR